MSGALVVRQIHGLQTSTHAYRLALTGALLLVFLWQDHLDPVVWTLWTRCQRNAWFRHDSFEVLFSTMSFALWLSLFWVIDHCIPSLRAYRFNIIESKVPERVDKLRWDELVSWQGRWRAASSEVVWYVGPWLVIDFFVRRRHLLMDTAESTPGIWTLLLQMVLSLLMYDVSFYAGHRLMHALPYLTKIHAKHHSRGGNIRAIDGVRHTFIDGTFDVACSVIALRLVGSHPLARCLHNIVATFLISEAHSGYDFPCSPSRVIPGKLLLTPREHHAHHDHAHVNFSKFFTLWDRLLSTYECGAV